MASGRDISYKKVLNFLNADINKYPPQDAADIISEMYHQIQHFDMDDKLKDSPLADIYRESYKNYMGKEELIHSGDCTVDEVDYVEKNGTLFDRDGKLFVSPLGDIITLENCTDYFPKEEAEASKEALLEKREAELGSKTKVIKSDKMLEDSSIDPADGEFESHEADKDDWLHSFIEDQDIQQEQSPFSMADADLSFGATEDLGGPDFGL